MNALLFSAGLLLLLLQPSSNLKEICYLLSSFQCIVGAPFLTTHPVSYIRKSFELDRVFFFEWTVNWKFLPENIFTSKLFSSILLLLHLVALGLFCKKWLQSVKKQIISSGSKTMIFLNGSKLSSEYVVFTLFVSNFIGITFARTLHYQFYSWYFHSLPMLLWMTILPFWLKILILGIVEYAFNVFPATKYSSIVLQIAHFFLLFALWHTEVPKFFSKAGESFKKK